VAKVDRALLVKLEAIRRDVEMLRTDLITCEREKAVSDPRMPAITKRSCRTQEGAGGTGSMTLGPHIINTTPAAMTWAARAGIVKQTNGISALQAAPDAAIRIFRCSYPNETDTSDPVGTVNQIVAALKGYWHKNLYVQIWCGAHPTFSQLKQAVTLCHLNNLKCGGSRWFTGDYTQADWDIATNAGVDAYFPQCYFGDAGFTQDHAVRYRQFWRPGQAPVAIVEAGRDAVENGKAGWKLCGLTAQQYADELIAYDAEISKDSFVLGATPFTSGPSKDWSNFDMDPISPLLGGTVPVPTPVPTPPPIIDVSAIIPGIDIADYQQGPNGIDWPAVAAYGLALHPEFFVDIKVCQGLTYVNEFLFEQRMGAHAAGIKNIGLYDYVTPSANSGHDEATFFNQTVGLWLPGEYAAMDDEDPNVPATADLAAFALDWLGTNLALMGKRAFHYSGKYYLTPHNLTIDPRLGDFPLWQAIYGLGFIVTPKAWKKTSKWQFSSTGSVPGIVGNVDLDYFLGDLTELRQYQFGF